MVKVGPFGTASFSQGGSTHPRPAAAELCQASCSPSVFYVKWLDAVAHVVLERRVSDRHAILAPLESLFIDGLH